jgi:hypothetical protein
VEEVNAVPPDCQNHLLRFEPIRGGIVVQNPVVGQLGTIGLIATSDGADRWIVSCYHVLCRNDGSAFPHYHVEPIYQPFFQDADAPIAMVDGSRINAELDCAAALVSVETIPQIFPLGTLSAPRPPAVGIRVLKSGADTGVTEGVITGVNGNRVTVEAVGMPPDYQLTGPGDSGAVWINATNNAPVALHQQGDPNNPGSISIGIDVTVVLAALGLRLCLLP